MNLFQNILCICIGASLGALCRWALSLGLNYLFPLLPPGTLLANLTGSFLMGLLLPLMTSPALAQYLRPMLLIGFLGSFTTFSTFAAEMGELLEKENFIWLSFGILLHVGGSICLFLLGLFLGKLMQNL